MDYSEEEEKYKGKKIIKKILSMDSAITLFFSS